MASGGIIFGSARPLLASVTANGVPSTDPRVQIRTDEAQKEILDTLIPVNGMQTVDVIATGTTLLLPKEMENAIEVQVLGNATVNNQTDVTQGWAMVNQFAYITPESAHDNPLIDQYLQPDPNDSSILRRQYDYPGLSPNSTVRVTGAKRWLPIVNDNTYLIVQNVPALKQMIQAIEADENNDHQGAQAFRQACFERLQAEIKKHQLDPINSLKRKAAYDADLVNYRQNTFGWTRARLAFELTNGLNMGKSELTRVLEQAEMRIMDKIQAVGTLKEYEADVVAGLILAPKEVDTIIAADFCCQPLDIHSWFARYHKNGRHYSWGCPDGLRDEGQIRDSDGDLRRQYRLAGSTTDTHKLRFIAKLRWVKKVPTDYMTIQNFEALRMMCSSILHQKNEKYQEAIADEQLSIQELDKQISEYLSGQQLTAPVDFNFGFRSHGLL